MMEKESSNLQNLTTLKQSFIKPFVRLGIQT